MYVPAAPALPAAPLTPVGVAAGGSANGEAGLPPSGAQSTKLARVETALRVRHANLNVLDGRTATVTGTLRVARTAGVAGTASAARAATAAEALTAADTPIVADAPIVLQARRRHSWRTLAGTHTDAHGHYHVRYRPARIGSELLRVYFKGDATARASHHRLGHLNVYRLAGASWYGGGGSLACGGWLTSLTMGVANKTLPCGTLVTLRYGGRTVRVPVIDRGPYVAGREFDLTEATKRALGFEGTGDVWATA